MSLRRWLFRIALCLVLGVVTTVGVAWGCTLFLNPFRGIQEGSLRYSPEESWNLNLWSGAGVVHVRYRFISPHELYDPQYRAYGIDPQVLIPSWGELREPEQSTYREATGSGWPMIALWTLTRDGYVGMERPGSVIDGMTLGRWQSDVSHGGTPVYSTKKVLPMRPVWLGFVVDVSFYATFWFVLLFTPARFKRWNRTRRGLCPKCKYNLSGNPEGVTGCAECGWGRDDAT